MSDPDPTRRGERAAAGPGAIVVSLVVAALALGGAWVLWSAEGRSPGDREVVEWIDPVLVSVAVVERDVVDADRYLRLYVMQGRPPDAKSFEVRRAEAERSLGELQRAAAPAGRDVALAAGELAAAVTKWLGLADEWYRTARTAELDEGRAAVLARIGPEDPLASIRRPRERLEAIARDARAARLDESAAAVSSRAPRAAFGFGLVAAAVALAAWAAARGRRSPADARGTLDLGLVRGALDQVPDGIAIFGADGRLLVSNHAAARVVERGEADAGRLALFDRAGEPVAAADAPLERALAGHHIQEREYAAERPDGSKAPLELLAEPVLDGGRVAAAVVVLRDRSERDRIEAEAQASARRAEGAEATAAELARRLREMERRLAEAEERLAEAAATAEQAARDAETARAGRGDWKIEQVLLAIANDLRTPILSIRGMVELFRQKYAEAVPDVTALHYLELTQRNADQIATLIDELSDLSRLSESEMHVTEFPLTATIEEAWRASQHGGVELRVAGPLPTVRADRAKLLRALRDLFDTAARRRRPGPGAWMHIAVRDLADRWELELTDNGAGLEGAEGELLFGPLARSAAAADGGPTLVGGGLGLAAVRRIAELHGGTASAAAGPDEGAAYTLTLAKR